MATDIVRIGRALLSVSDKTGLLDLARALKPFGVDFLSTGGTAAALNAAGIEVVDVAQITSFPEMMDGRVKLCTRGCTEVCWRSEPSRRIRPR